MQYNFFCDINFSARCFFSFLNGRSGCFININIDDKYEIIKTLHQSAATAVILVRHKKIGALRILKAISKASPNANSILSEAHLLQGINSSLLPTIFEVEETDEVYYLIEEYIDGISLREYFCGARISRNELIRLSIQLCELIELLHTAGNEPVLYLDMKPEHVFMQEGKLRLIDLGNSIRKSISRNIVVDGTPNWSAPEQLNREQVDERADVYSVCKVIEFMQESSYAKDDYKIKKIVSRGIAIDKDFRTRTIVDVKKQLINLLEKENDKTERTRHLDRIIAVVGEQEAVGTTHIAIALCKFFNEKKTNAYYKDIKKNTVNELWKYLKGTKLKEGILYHDSFKGIMNYGDAVRQYQPPIGLKIIDCGTEISDFYYEADMIIYVTSGAPWKYKTDTPEWIMDENVYVINNFSNRLSTIKKAKEINKRVFMYPTVKRNLRLSKEEEKVFKAIIKNEKDY